MTATSRSSTSTSSASGSHTEQRSTFTSVIRNNGGDFNALLDHLRKQINKAEAGEIPDVSAAN